MALTLVDVSFSSPSPGLPADAAVAQKRSHPRFSALSPAMLVTIDGVSQHCLVEDLSSSGALVTGGLHLTDGQRVTAVVAAAGTCAF